LGFVVQKLDAVSQIIQFVGLDHPVDSPSNHARCLPDDLRRCQPYFLCRCDCGRELSVRGANLRSGNTTSCGCSRRKARKWRKGCRTIHHQFVFGKDATSGRWVACCKFCVKVNMHTEKRLKNCKVALCACLRRTRNSWRKMIERCTSKNAAQYADYGGRGITVCDRWRESFSDFVEDMKPRPEGTTLDRYPNNDGNYEPGNCRWATKKQQAANRRKPAKRMA